MTWRASDPQGNEAGKVRFDVLRYLNGRVLDLGCGRHKVVAHAIGVDSNIDQKLFGIECNPNVVVKTCEDLAIFGTESADAVFSSHLLEHIANYQAALREWWRLIKIGGYLVLYLPDEDEYPKVGEPHANIDHKWNVNYERVVDAMREAGEHWDLLDYQKRNKEQEYSLLFVFQKRAAGGHQCSYQEPKPKRKTLGFVRLGAFGDSLWITDILAQFKEQGYHITLYSEPAGEEVLRHDPHIDEIICQPYDIFEFGEGHPVPWWQTQYWIHEEKKYDKFVNAVGSTERRLLMHTVDIEFYLPYEQRHRIMNKNYVEELHRWCGVPYDKARAQQKFYPTDEERDWAREERAAMDGPLVVINPGGSSQTKWWPHTKTLIDLLDAMGVHSVVVGDLRGEQISGGDRARVVGLDWSIRKALSLAQVADVVVGVESAVVNAVAYEPMRKIVLLSHSSVENLTRDWVCTSSVVPNGLACHPCHRIHNTMEFCTPVAAMPYVATCQSVGADDIFRRIMRHLDEQKHPLKVIHGDVTRLRAAQL